MERGAIHIRESGALVGAKKRPRAVIADAFHEEVGGPQRVKQISRPLILVAVVFLHLQEILNVRVPRLQIDREGAVAFPPLVDEPRGVVEHFEHGRQTAR